MYFSNLFLQIDSKIFIEINQKFTNTFFDIFFPYITNCHKSLEFKLLLPILILLWIFFHKKKALLVLAGLLLTLGLSDLFSSQFLKPLFARPRPSHSPYKEALKTQLRLPFSPQNASFPSSHAFNTSAVSTFLSFIYPPITWVALALSLLIGYSRIYVGVHFPADVLAGLLLGSLMGGLIFFYFNKLSHGKVKKLEEQKETIE